MTYKYNPTATELRQAYEVAFGGDLSIYKLYGALFANVKPETIERLYVEALEIVKDNMGKTIFCVYCETQYNKDTTVCPECNEYDGLIQTKEAEKEGYTV